MPLHVGSVVVVSVMVSHASSLLLRCFPAVAVAVAPTVASHQVPSEILLHPKEKFTDPRCALLTVATPRWSGRRR